MGNARASFLYDAAAGGTAQRKAVGHVTLVMHYWLMAALRILFVGNVYGGPSGRECFLPLLYNPPGIPRGIPHLPLKPQHYPLFL